MKRPALVLLAALPLAAHNYPLSHGTLAVLPGGVQLKLRLALHHFQPALETFAGRPLTPADDAAFDPALLEAYFKGKLELLKPDGTALAFTVVKQELDPRDLVVTLEALTDAPAALRLRNAVLMEVDRRQKNLVTVEGLGRRRGLTFEAKTRVLPLAEAP